MILFPLIYTYIFSEFVTKVEEKFSKDTDLILACQKGLRSLAACEKLYNAGYQNLFWVQGGLEAANEEVIKSFSLIFILSVSLTCMEDINRI